MSRPSAQSNMRRVQASVRFAWIGAPRSQITSRRSITSRRVIDLDVPIEPGR